MKKTNNNSFNRIVDYLIENDFTFLEEDKKFLMNYAASIYLNGVENIQDENIKDIINDTKKINIYLLESDRNNFINGVEKDYLKLLKQISSHFNGNEKIDNISLELDKLYLKLGLPPRKNSSLSYNLKNYKKEIKR